ncbi:MAG: transcription initiation factor IIB family protein, partial [Melioribacteraceae bacterium]|nr:transcription initiation factor IIB family protein [Melioribacteraceae bacterium]
MMNELPMKDEEKLYNLIDSLEEEEFETEELECEHSDSLIDDYTNGYIVCTSCGQVFRELFDTRPEWRNFNEHGETDKARCNTMINHFLPKSSISTTFGNYVNYRVKEIVKWDAMPYDERSLYKILKRIETKCREGKILKCAEDEAKILYANISKCKYTEGEKKGKAVISRGNPKKGLIAACVYNACKRIGITRKPKEIAKLFGITQHYLTDGCKRLAKLLKMINMNYNVRKSSPEDFVPRLCKELNMKKCYIVMSTTIAKNIDKLNIASVPTPLSIASGSILLMSDLNNLNITRKMIAESFGVSESTVMKSYKKIANYGPILINDDLTNQIVEFINEENKKIKMTQKVEKKYKEFQERFADDNIHKKFNEMDERIY